jgi:hypothetical protein
VRWVVIDPVVHYDFSPYNAFDNNPVFWADPSGANSTTLMELFYNAGSGITTYTNNGDGTFSQMGYVSDAELVEMGVIPNTDLSTGEDGDGGGGNGGIGGFFKKVWRSIFGKNEDESYVKVEPLIMSSFGDNVCGEPISCNPLNVPSSQLNLSYFDRISGYIQMDGEMTSGFVGGTIGRNGVIYNTIEAPLTPGPELFDTRRFSDYLNDLRSFSDGFSLETDIYSAIESRNENIQFKTFTYDTFIKVNTTNPVGIPIIGKKDVQRTGYYFITNGDTLIIK